MLTAVARGVLSSAERARKSNGRLLSSSPRSSISRFQCLSFFSSSSSSSPSSSPSSSSDLDDRPTTTAAKKPASDRREVLLLRDYISRRLSLYFSAPADSSPVGELSSALQEAKEQQRNDDSSSSPSSLDFPSFPGRSSYEMALSKLYERLSVSWLTPSELFSPHYGRAVARFVAEDAKRRRRSRREEELEEENNDDDDGDADDADEKGKQKNSSLPPRLRVVEVGAGKGTLAADFLSYLKEVEPGMHARTTYVALDFSESLAEAQRRKVASSTSSSSSSFLTFSSSSASSSFSSDDSASALRSSEPRFRSVVGDATDLGSWRRAAAAAFEGDGAEKDENRDVDVVDDDDDDDDDDDHLYILAFEVLDNLPHDRVVASSPDRSEESEETKQIEQRWMQTHVEVEPLPSSSSSSSSPSPSPSLFRATRELLRSPADDPLVSLCLSASDKWRESDGGKGDGAASAVSRLLDWMLSIVDGGSGRKRARTTTTTTSEGLSDVDDVDVDVAENENDNDIVFLPTGAASMFSSAFAVAPNHTIVAADFDALPGVAVAGSNAPLVSSTSGGGVARDYPSLYSPPPGAAVDIFFPTNFDALCDLYEECGRRTRRRRRREEGEEEEERREATTKATAKATDDDDDDAKYDDDDDAAAATAGHCKSSAFLSLAADTAAYSRAAVSTASGWSPMLDDWENTSVFVGRSRARSRARRGG